MSHEPYLPRWLDPAALAAYLCVRVDRLPKLVGNGILPAPDYSLGKRSPRWDRESIDAVFTGEQGSAGMTLEEACIADAKKALKRTRR